MTIEPVWREGSYEIVPSRITVSVDSDLIRLAAARILRREADDLQRLTERLLRSEDPS